MKAVNEMQSPIRENLTWLSKCMTLLLVLWTTLASTSAAQAGGLDGGGGQILVCHKAGQKYYQLYDYWKANDGKIRIPKKDFEAAKYKLPSKAESEALQIDSQFTSKNYRERLSVLLKRLERLSSLRARIYRKWAENFENEALIDRESSITYVADSSGFVPNNCDKESIVVIKQMEPKIPGEKRYSINGKIWDELDQFPLVKAGLVMHELVYREFFLADEIQDFLKQPLRVSRNTGARPVHYINAIIGSTNFIHMSQKQFLKSLVYANPLFFEIPNGFPVLAEWDDLIPNSKYSNDQYNYHTEEYRDNLYFGRIGNDKKDETVDRPSESSKLLVENMLLSHLSGKHPNPEEWNTTEWNNFRNLTFSPKFSSTHRGLVLQTLREQDPTNGSVFFFSSEESEIPYSAEEKGPLTGELVWSKEDDEVAWGKYVVSKSDGTSMPILRWVGDHNLQNKIKITLFGKTITLDMFSEYRYSKYGDFWVYPDREQGNLVYYIKSFYSRTAIYAAGKNESDIPEDERNPLFWVSVDGKRLSDKPITSLDIDFTERKFKGIIERRVELQTDPRTVEIFRDIVFEY